MARVIALTQFIFLALGTMALIVLMKTTRDHAGALHEWRLFLTSYSALWIILIPVVWVLGAEVVGHFSSSAGVARLVQASGVLLATVIIVGYGWLIFSF